MSESERGCGFRKIGALYLVSDAGPQIECDGLPIPLEHCGCCGFVPQFSRGLQRLNAEYIVQAQLKNPRHQKIVNEPSTQREFDHQIIDDIDSRKRAYTCKCSILCPVCHARNPTVVKKGIFGLMFVGESYYTPESFVKEASTMGISKRINEIPNWLTLGETWVLLAHKKTPNVELGEITGNGLLSNDKTRPAIFYGFVPSRIEMPLFKGDLTNDEILRLEQRGITPVLLDKTPENIKRHKPAKDMSRKLLKYLREEDKEEEEE